MCSKHFEVQAKNLGLSASSDKCYVLTDGIHTQLLELQPLKFFESIQKNKNCHINLFFVNGGAKIKSELMNKIIETGKGFLIMSLR